jgi:Xaa-Pro aminopeptidase
MKIKISQAEYQSRIERIRDKLKERNAGALILFSAKRIAYLTGYHLIATERPLAVVITPKGIWAFVPRLELEAAQAQPLIGEVEHYFEYPGRQPPLKAFVDHLRKRGLKRVVADSDGYPSIWGYEGPKLSELKVEVEVNPKMVDEMWCVKSPQEIELIKESALWGNLAHAKLQQYTEVGASEIEISLKASYEASKEMLLALGPEYGSHFRGGMPVHAGFISGERTALPHAMSLNRKIKEGDVLITGASADIWGYVSELERTMIVGEPTDEQQHYFEIMLEAQTIGIEASGPGVPLAEVDRKVQNYLKKQKVEKYSQHHTGHHLGFAPHEPPFIDENSKEEMQPGQVYSIEPGLYIAGKAGYRHSDTILITEKGVELITYYPRDMESLIIPA